MIPSKKIDFAQLNNPMSYQEYMDLIHQKHSFNQSTSGKTEDGLFEYSKLNLKRTQRVEKLFSLLDETKVALLKNSSKRTWLVLTESWCGDASLSLPMIKKIADSNPNIELKIVLRDQNEDLMNDHLTDGSKSIPILIALDENFYELWHWGPRPEPAQQMSRDWKINKSIPKSEFTEILMKWYNQDKGITIQKEIVSKIVNFE
jgi:hypothetical protein